MRYTNLDTPLELNSDNFDETVSKYQLTFINVYMRWCAPCMDRDLWQAWDDLVTEMEHQNQPVQIARYGWTK